MSSSRRRIIFFDLDGTLLESRVRFPAVFRQLLAEHGVERDEEEVEVAIQATWPWYEANVADYRDEELDFWFEFNRRVCAALDAGERADPAGRAITDTFQALDAPTLYDDVLPCLDALRGSGFTLGVITARPSAARVLEPVGIVDRFRYLVDAFSAGSAKHDERTYRYAISLAGISGERAVHVGDQLTRDVMPAQAAGLTAVLIDRDGLHGDTTCPRMTSLTELPSWLEAGPGQERRR